MSITYFIMKKYIISSKFSGVLKPLLPTLIVLLAAPSFAFAAFAPVTTQLDLGDRGSDVTNLQIFLSANPSVYPQGLVTGYFGGLTQNAVSAFQSLYGISVVGRVGPVTIAKINQLITSGTWGSIVDVSGPQFLSLNQSINRTSATFTWTTNEMANARIFYDTAPVRMNEGDINSVGFGQITGYTMTNDNQLRNSQSVSLSNLQPNTTYYYTLVSTDASGNVSVWNPNATFRTSF